MTTITFLLQMMMMLFTFRKSCPDDWLKRKEVTVAVTVAFMANSGCVNGVKLHTAKISFEVNDYRTN